MTDPEATKAYLIKKALNEIGGYKFFIEYCKKVFPFEEFTSTFPMATFGMQLIFSQVQINFPLDNILIRDVRRWFEKEGWAISKIDQTIWESHMDAMRSFDAYPPKNMQIGNSKYRNRVEVRFLVMKEGSVCTLKQVSTETIERPVFEIVCKEGAKEVAL